MSKKIVIIPIFCESHLVKYQIPNLIDTINPDIIIYNEGMFPAATEGNTPISKSFIDEFTLNGEGKRGFDYLELKDIIKEAQEKYTDVKIILNEMDYTDTDSTINYTKACTNFDELGIEVNEGDYIFPLEGDVFHHEDSKEEIQGYCEQLQPNQGFRSMWIDYVGNQYYVEKCTIKPYLLKEPEWKDQYRSRKICIRFGDMDFYKQSLSGFMSQQYEMLFPTDLITYHYAWVRPDKYADLRYSQLNRHAKYWEGFKNGFAKIFENKYNQIDVRPFTHEPHLTFRYLRFFDIKQPKHIQSHPCFDNVLTEDEKNKIKNNDLRFNQ